MNQKTATKFALATIVSLSAATYAIVEIAFFGLPVLWNREQWTNLSVGVLTVAGISTFSYWWYDIKGWK